MIYTYKLRLLVDSTRTPHHYSVQHSYSPFYVSTESIKSHSINKSGERAIAFFSNAEVQMALWVAQGLRSDVHQNRSSELEPAPCYCKAIQTIQGAICGM